MTKFVAISSKLSIRSWNNVPIEADEADGSVLLQAYRVCATTDALPASPGGISLDQIKSRFVSRGPWKKRLPIAPKMLGAVGRVRTIDGRYRQA